MSEIKIIEKIVAPNANWTQLIVDTHIETVTQCAYKIKFDRTYPYFWVCPRFGGMGGLHTFYISAQDDPVCPFVSANPFVG